MVDQAALRELFLASLDARGLSLDDVTFVEDGRRRPREPAAGPSALAILRRFQPAEYVRGAAGFVARLDEDAREAWYRAFTRTAFLVGDPRRLAARFGPLLTHRTDGMAWAWSPDDHATLGLRRLLKPLRTAAPPVLEPELGCDLGSGAPKEVGLATGGLRLEDYLVHLNHTICEALITGALDPHDRVVLLHRPAIDSLPPDCAYVRVVPAADGADRLAVAAYVRERAAG